jgi:hypothetical protein
VNDKEALSKILLMTGEGAPLTEKVLPWQKSGILLPEEASFIALIT